MRLNLETQKAMEEIGFMVIRGYHGKPLENPKYFAYLKNSDGKVIGEITVETYADLCVSAFDLVGKPIIGYKYFSDRPATAKLILNRLKKLGLEIEKAF